MVIFLGGKFREKCWQGLSRVVIFRDTAPFSLSHGFYFQVNEIFAKKEASWKLSPHENFAFTVKEEVTFTLDCLQQTSTNCLGKIISLCLNILLDLKWRNVKSWHPISCLLFKTKHFFSCNQSTVHSLYFTWSSCNSPYTDYTEL